MRTQNLICTVAKIWLKIIFCMILGCVNEINAQSITIDGEAGGKRFEGIGAVSGGGATSVLLKDYPAPQRNQILDLLFKPDFGASLSTLLVEVPGDGNSTQGSEPSHMHSREDENYSRGYEWWLMSEAKKRNSSITFDANGWSCPKWIGNGNFWSQDMCNYYVKWIEGLKNVYGIDLNAIGCRNERGVNLDFVKMLRTTLNKCGLSKVKIHAFDNWNSNKFDWCKTMLTDSVLRASVDVISAHTMSEIPTPPSVIKLSEHLNKPIWNTEEHIYKKGFDCEISLVASFNRNFIISGATKVVNWYLIGSTYGIEPFSNKPPMMIARQPWGGNYHIRKVLWGYAHYGQFTGVGWQYLKGACDTLLGGGSYVTLKSPGKDYSIIAETKNAKENQILHFTLKGGLSNSALCVWRSNAKEQFLRLQDITPVNGHFQITLEPESIYSISTLKGQQKGSFTEIPTSQHFPFPYYDNFESYKNAGIYGYLPHYTADISGVFELAERPDHKGKCLHQVVKAGAQSWAPDWTPYTIIGDSSWGDYEVSAEVYPNKEGWAGVMGRVSATGTGYGCKPSGYYCSFSADGTCRLFVTQEKGKNKMGKLLATAKIPLDPRKKWHQLLLRFSGTDLTCLLDGRLVLSAVDSTFAKGMAGLISGSKDMQNNDAYFDNLLINKPNGRIPDLTVFSKDIQPIYKNLQ